MYNNKHDLKIYWEEVTKGWSALQLEEVPDIINIKSLTAQVREKRGIFWGNQVGGCSIIANFDF